MLLLLVAIGGALGSLLRYVLTGLVDRFTPPLFPYGTFVVNVIGCAVFGVLAGVADDRAGLGVEARAFLLVGVLGGFTTFSAFGFETLELLGLATSWRQPRMPRARSFSASSRSGSDWR